MKIFSSSLFASGAGFTLVEMLLVITIIGLFSSILFVNSNSARERAKAAEAISTARTLKSATILYYDDMEFPPPDVERGWDPGFVYRFPNNPDTGKVKIKCSHCPSNWQDIVEANWNGPYIATWPRFTPWKGKYHYNYWDKITTRSGCKILPGIYIGVEGDYQNKNTIPEQAEEVMINNGNDNDGCLNGEAQMILFPIKE